MQWCDKYKPQTITDICGHKSTIQRITQFLNTFGKKHNCIVLTGKNGIGKTLLATLIPHELGYHVKYVNEIHKLKNLINNTGMFTRNNKEVIVYEAFYVDKISDDLEYIKKSKQPIIFVADSTELDKYKSIKKLSDIICLRPPTLSDIKPLLKKIGVKYKDEFDGDVRSLLLNLQMNKLITKDKPTISSFKVLPQMFDYNISIEQKCDMFHDLHLLPSLVYYNYVSTKIKPDTDIYESLQKTIQSQMLIRAKINAKKYCKENGLKKIKIKQPIIEKSEMNNIYKMHMISNSLEQFSSLEVIREHILSTQKYDLLPTYIYLLSASTLPVSGILPEYSIIYKL